MAEGSVEPAGGCSRVRRTGTHYIPWAAALVYLLVLARPALAADHVTLQLKWHPQFQFAGYYVAQAKGFFADEGLDVTIIPGWPEIVTPDVVNKGGADFGVSGADLLVYRAAGMPLVSVAAIFQHNAVAVMVRDDSPIRSSVGLVGHTFEATRHTDDLPVRAAMRADGADPDKLHYVKPSWGIEGLRRRKVDALLVYTTNEVDTAQRLKLPFRLIRPSSSGVDFYGDVLFTTERYASEHPTIVARFRHACQRGWYYALDTAHRNEAIACVARAAAAKGMKLDPRHLAAEAAATRDLVEAGLVEIGHQNPDRWERIGQHLRKDRLLTGPVDISHFIWSVPAAAPSVGEPRGYAAIVAALAVLGLSLLVYFARYSQLRRAMHQRSRELVTARRDLELRDRALHSLLELGYTLTGARDARDMLTRVVSQVQRGADFDRVGLYLVDAKANELRGALAADSDGGIEDCSHVAASLDDVDNPLVQVAAGRRALFVTGAGPSGSAPLGVRHNALVPLSAAGRILGVLAVDSRQTDRPFDQDEIRQLRGFADEVALALHNAQLLREAEEQQAALKQSNRELRVLADFGREASLARTPNEMIALIVHTTRDKLGFDRAAVFIRDGDRMVGVLGTDERGRDVEIRAEGWDASLAAADEHGRAILSGDTDMVYTADLYARYGVRTAHGKPVRHHVLVPLRVHDQVVGVLTADNAITERAFGEPEARPLISFARHAATALENVQLQDALRSSEGQLRALVSSLSAIIYSGRLTPAGRVALTYASPQLETLTGYTVAEAIAMGSVFWDTIVHPDDAATMISHLDDFLAGRPVVLEHRIVRRDGAIRWVLDIPVAGRDGRGEVQTVNGAVIDVTERRQLEEQLRRAQKMETVGTLAGGVAHDFNTLLTIIGGNIEMALLDLPKESPAVHSLGQTLKAVRRAADLTGQLLTFSRRSEACYERVSLHELVAETVPLLQAAVGKSAVLEVHSDPDTGAVYGDAAQIQQVFINLCVNARDALPNGGTITVTTRNVSVREEDRSRPLEAIPGDYVRLQVHDTGTGMDEATQQRVFEPFFTTKAVGQGTGLGLAVAYTIVGEHKGWIEVKSSPGAGSVFSVYLPAADAVRSEPIPVPDRSHSVLIVDPDDAGREALADILEAAGYSALTAADGSEALALFWSETDRVALAVCAVDLHEMGAAQLVQHLRGYSPHVPVLLAVRGVGRIEPSVRAIGPDGILRKPYAADDVLRAVAKAVALPTS